MTQFKTLILLEPVQVTDISGKAAVQTRERKNFSCTEPRLALGTLRQTIVKKWEG